MQCSADVRCAAALALAAVPGLAAPMDPCARRSHATREGGWTLLPRSTGGSSLWRRVAVLVLRLDFAVVAVPSVMQSEDEGGRAAGARDIGASVGRGGELAAEGVTFHGAAHAVCVQRL